MVIIHHPSPPGPIVVKRARRSSPLTRSPTCLWPDCNAALAHDHDAPVCGYHVRPGYRLCHDKRAASLVLHLLMAAYPGAVDLCAVLHCTSHEGEDRVEYLRRRGHSITGAGRGYVLELPAVADRLPRGARRVGT